jgi:hypothetical protein
MIGTRLQKVLTVIISKAQNGFVKGCKIHDNKNSTLKKLAIAKIGF